MHTKNDMKITYVDLDGVIADFEKGSVSTRYQM